MSQTKPTRAWNIDRSRTSSVTGMPRALRNLTILTSLGALALGTAASARSLVKSEIPVHFDQQFVGGAPAEPFAMVDAPLGAPKAPAAAATPMRTGAAIATIRGGMLIADDDSGELVRTNADGEVVATLEIGRGLSQVVVDDGGKRAFAVDRGGDRITIIDLTRGLEQVDAYRTRAEPFGIAVSADGASLLVTTVADRMLSSIDIATGNERWSVEVAHEPRGVAVDPAGGEALVTFLTTGAVARVKLSADAHKAPKISYIALDPANRQATGFDSMTGAPKHVDPVLSDEGKSFARNAFAAAYIGHGLAVVPHQLSTPHLASEDVEVEASGYGGGNGFTPPVSHRLAFLDMPDAGERGGVQLAMATTSLHQPRAVAYDGNSDTLYLASFGGDQLQAIANVSQASVHASWSVATTPASGGACGPTGLAVDPANGDVAVWCSLTRSIVRVAPAAPGEAPAVVSRTPALTTSHLSLEAQAGRELFRSGNDARISTFGAMACSSCHPEARADGLSWRLQGNNLQTPFLAGRIAGAHPFKWDGKDPTIQDSLTNTVTRLGGSGITVAQAQQLNAFLESVDAPRKPTTQSPAAVARGKALFDSDATGCATCHSGPLMTDNQQYEMAADLGEVDTPSLVGLASSAPYYHDGSAATLEALLRGNGKIHGMGRISKLSESDIGDLVEYLKTL